MPKEERLKFTGSVRRTATVESFRFTPAEKIDFNPGQFLQLVFDEADPSNKELNKFLSFSSVPGEEHIEVTKRISDSPFCHKLKGLGPGDEVLFKGPFGTCIFCKEYRKIAFLVGGIGVTPVVSIAGYIAARKIPTDTVIFYSNRNEEEVAFKEELDSWARACPNIKIVYTITDCQPRDHRCVYGRIDQELLSQRLGDIRERIVFIFGPPQMVEAMRGLCLELGCSENNIKVERFTGY